MKEEIKFNKYAVRGADYHYKNVNKSNLKVFNAYTESVYKLNIHLVKKYCNDLSTNKNSELKILDVGCGDGVLLYLLNKELSNNTKTKLYGVDLSQEAIDVANIKIPNATFKTCGVYDIDFEDDFFDIIVSSDVIEHVQYPEKMLKEISRVSKNSAKVVISTPIRLTETPQDKMHVQEFFQSEFIELCSKFFNFEELHQSHCQYKTLKYRKLHSILGLSIGFNRYLYNLSSIVFNNNPFLKFTNNKNSLLNTYMYFTGNNSLGLQ